jgi:hypothetical protein
VLGQVFRAFTHKTRPVIFQKRAVNAQLMQSTNAEEALRLHKEAETVTAQLAEAEDRWCQLQEEVEGSESS